MDYRNGKCSSCNAEYKIPGSFQHDSAKCKMCGGVVAIGPVQKAEASDEPKPARPKAPAPKPVARKPIAPKAVAPKPAPAAPEAKPALEPIEVKKKHREGPSMKEKILARRREEAAAAKAAASGTRPAAAAQPVAKPAAKPVAKPAVAPIARKTAAAASGAVVASARPTRAKGGSAATSTRAGGSRRAGGRTTARREKSNKPMIIGAVAFLAVAAVGAVMFKDQLFGPSGGEIMAAEDPAESQVDEAVADAEATADADADAKSEKEAEVEVADATDADKQETPAPEGEADADAKPDKPKEVKGDPSTVDLTVLTDFGPADKTTPEEWKHLQMLAKKALDPDAGAAGTRAVKELSETPRKAFPAVMNQFRLQDVSTTVGQLNGDVAQRLFEEFGKGKNYGWKYTTDPHDVYFNKKAIISWHKTWAKLEKDLEQWKGFAKLTDEEYAELLESIGASEAASEGDSGGDEIEDEDDFLDVED